MAVAHNRPAPGSASVQTDTRSEVSTPPPGSVGASSSRPLNTGHQRTYQACIPCRRRKVRCDLGSVDNPHDPPCKRCSRESKECFFSATRRKKKNRDGADIDSDTGEQEAVYEIKNRRKRLRTSSVAVEDYEGAAVFEEDRPRTPGGSRGRPVPLRRPTQHTVQYGEEDEKASEQTAAILQAAEVHGGHDALKVLYQAALRGRTNSGTSMPQPSSVAGISPTSLPPTFSPIAEQVGPTSYTTGPLAIYQSDNIWKTSVDPVMPKTDVPTSAPASQIGYNSALRAWSRFRFVRAGWLTAKEAIDYVDYFCQYLLPLTPVQLPGFRFYKNHEKLLKQEPMLTVTILLIASRHMKLDGPGSTSRPFSIHQKLWTYLSGMISRLVWGQEQFGGGFCGAGSEAGSDVNPLTRKGLRTLGTVESLILLTEWHPRAMHFPPDDDDDDLMMTEGVVATPDLSGAGDGSKGIGGQRMDAWLEPCWRSDRMCWMLLGMAMSLSFEIGVFDSSDWQRHAKSTSTFPLSAEDLQAYDQRRGNVRELMLIYVTQTSGRLGLTSMLPATYSKPEDSGLYKRHIGQHESMQETILHFWLRMAAILREGNQKIFANKAFTRDLIRNGDYKAALDSFETPLSEWRIDLDRCMSIPKYMRCILLIEFEYCRVYINALALQAVAERCANEQPIPVIDPPLEMARSAADAMGSNGERGEVPIDAPTLSKWLGGDRKYMLAVGDAARNLLKVVVEDLYPGEYLKHAPVRTYFRIISVAIMLLKSFSLGATESDVTDSLLLMDRTVEALRTCIVDDVHVASRFADLLDTLTTNLKPRLVRVAPDGQHGRGRRVSHFNIAEAGPELLQSANQKLEAHAQHHATTGAPQPHQQWYHGSQMQSGNMSVGSKTAPSHPLYGISNDTYDIMGTDHPYSIMPPPSFGLQSPHATKSNAGLTPGANSNYDPYGNLAGADDWLALPLDPLLNITGAEVDQTMYGPSLGGQDMLELLLGSTNNQNTGQNNGF